MSSNDEQHTGLDLARDASDLTAYTLAVARVLAVGDRIEKRGGDYRFAGEVVAVFNKRNGVVRYVVENDDGILHIFSAANLQQASKPIEPHAYVPDVSQFMGDCAVCGHTQSSPVHI